MVVARGIVDFVDGINHIHDVLNWDGLVGTEHIRKLYFENIQLEGEDLTAEDVIVVMVPSGTVAPAEDAEAFERYQAYQHFFDRQYMHYTAQPYDVYELSKKDVKALTEKE